jgi:hypothetical protein
LTVSIDQVLITGVGTGVRSPAATLTVSSSEVRGSVGLSTGGTLVASAFRCSCSTGIQNTGTATLTYADISASDALVNGGSMTITRSTATSEPFGAAGPTGRPHLGDAGAVPVHHGSTAVDLVGSTATITNTTIRPSVPPSPRGGSAT